MSDLDEFKKLVVTTVREWPEGCDEQKNEFLKSLGLYEPVKRSFTVDITMDHPVYDSDGDFVDTPEKFLMFALEVYRDRCFDDDEGYAFSHRFRYAEGEYV